MDGFRTGSAPSRTVSRVLLVVALIATAFYVGSQWPRGLGAAGEAGPRDVTPRGPLARAELSTIELFRGASPSVVYITTLEQRRIRFTRNVMQVPSGTGSGFIWDRSGHVVTNFHVIRNGDSFQVTLNDQTTWEATYVGGAPEKDLAVLKIEAPRTNLVPLPIGTSNDLQVGQSVYAIGNPFGLDYTLTTGIVSALGREIESLIRRPIRDVIQTDAAINPGNSGGPLLDSAGRLVGVNTQIYSPSGASAGIGFAIPVNTVNWVVPDLIQYGEIRRPVLGVSPFEDQVLSQSGLEIEGALIADITQRSGAEAAGLRGTRRTRRGLVLGDIITAIDGKKVTSSNDLFLLMERYDPGDVVEVEFVRDDQKQTAEVQLMEGAQRRR